MQPIIIMHPIISSCCIDTKGADPFFKHKTAGSHYKSVLPASMHRNSIVNIFIFWYRN